MKNKHKMRTIFGKDIKDFLNRNDFPFGKNEAGQDAQKKLYQLLKEVKLNLCLLYFMVTSLNIDSLRMMLYSEMFVRDLIISLIKELNKKQLTDEWVPVFESYIKRMEERQRFVHRIVKENLQLTKYFPYFKETGFEQIIFSDLEGSNVNEKYAECLKSFEIWEKENQDKINAHMVKVQPLIDALESERKRNKEKEKAEKEARREAEKEVKNELKEIKKNSKLTERERFNQRREEDYYIRLAERDRANGVYAL